VECKTARLLLEFARPNASELDRSEADALNDHLTSCPDCKAVAQSGRQADERIGQAMRDVSPPLDARTRLRQRLDAERKVLYRRWIVRRARDVAAAAAVLIAAWWGYVRWQHLHRPSIDVNNIAVEIAAMRADGVGPGPQEKWFRATYGTETVLPPDLNYGYLIECSMQSLDGRTVPKLGFFNGTNYASVLVLSAKQFDLGGSLQQSGSAASGITIEIRPHPSNPHYAYLVEYTGGSLDWLVVNTQPPTL
jgi:hypothetical protein